MRRDRFAIAATEPRADAASTSGAEIVVQTLDRLAFVDLTAEVAARVIGAEVHTGVCHVSTCHTTTALVLNENEPLLLDDLRRMLEQLVPDGARYAHDDIARRSCPPDEPRNGAAHCRALLLPSSQCLPILKGRLGLGRWQSLFLVELDGPRRRTLRLTVTGR
jgi:secondary thiamine-phosphate synthase enzyme